MKFLKVPYAEKDEAKALGARWNKDRKMWYVPDGQAAEPFERWLSGNSADEAYAAGPAPGRVDSYGGKPVVGQHYLALEHDCNPFESCPMCHPLLEKSGWVAAHAASAALLATIRLGKGK